MPIVATIAVLVFVAIAFGLRTWLQLRSTGESGFVGLRPGATAIERVAGAAMVLAFALVPVGAWLGAPVLPRGLASLGVFLVVLGTVGTFAAQVTMRDSWRIGVDPAARTALVTDGSFRWVRNPIFTMMIVASIGLALICPTPLLLVLPAVLVAALEVQVRVVEEPYLRAVHGERYLQWAARTGRFVPGVGRLS
ncbi:MAG: isoprenylcysteine carboxylmethyltransferase family protein [Deltaproteobacteria bacterium]|nr:isoprenylcysteine carboxylmethyltransferase family protein [Nannocystaceae bacterium]